MMKNWLELIGSEVTSFIEEIGRVVQLFGSTVRWVVRRPYRLRHTILQMEEVGFNSIPVVLITATFTGMVLALQSYIGFKRFNAESLVGTVVALSMTRELGPVLTGLIVAGRVGSAMAAELGTMRVTEQIDALTTLAVNPIKYLVVPRLLASLIMLPLLTVLSDVVGIMGGYFVSAKMLGANPVVYMRRTVDYLKLNDIYSGLLKAAVFGVIIAIIGCYKGFYTEGGAEGVGKATTGAVVISSMLILVSDYFLTALLF
jgi:phospholipid/cholesterol/gamma-HCH transport system permease protein